MNDCAGRPCLLLRHWSRLERNATLRGTPQGWEEGEGKEGEQLDGVERKRSCGREGSTVLNKDRYSSASVTMAVTNFSCYYRLVPYKQCKKREEKGEI